MGPGRQCVLNPWQPLFSDLFMIDAQVPSPHHRRAEGLAAVRRRERSVRDGDSICSRRELSLISSPPPLTVKGALTRKPSLTRARSLPRSTRAPRENNACIAHLHVRSYAARGAAPRRSGRCRQGTRDRRPPSSDRRAPSSGGPPSLSSASVVVEEPRADRIDVPGGRVAQDLRSFGSYTNRTIYG